MATTPEAVAELAAELERIEAVHGRTPKTLALVRKAIHEHGIDTSLGALALTANKRREASGR